jgi:GAF domain-containing protein/HAMP domain-containing protein
MTAGQQGLDTTFINGVERFAAYRPIPEVGYSLAIIVPSSELLSGAIAAREQLAASTASTTQASLLIVGAILLVAALAAILLGNTLTSPLVALTRTAEEITAGNLNARAPVKSRDEIGILSETLNMMTTNLRGMIQSLEQRVRDRTAALETATQEANRRAAQFEAVTRVTAAISSIRNVNELMPLVANVISEQFGYYHVGIFLNDEATQQAYLIAANSEGGRRMLSRHHGLRIGEQGIVGYVAARGEPRVARRVGEDVVFFDNPDLPSTRSEAALPLRSADRIIGVLDVQSTTEDAFNPDDLRVLAVLADQVSLAIENTRLFEMTQRSLVEAETLYRQYVRNAWSRIRADEQITGYRYSPRGVLQRVAESEARRDGGGGAGTADEAAAQLRVPIKLRDEVIGELVVRGTREGQWTQDQIDLVQAVAERVALAAENARLFDETSRRAERERLVTEITSKIRSSTDPQEMIRTAVSELRNVLGAAHVQIVPQTLPEASVEDQPGTAPEPNVTA